MKAAVLSMEPDPAIVARMATRIKSTEDPMATAELNVHRPDDASEVQVRYNCGGVGAYDFSFSTETGMHA